MITPHFATKFSASSQSRNHQKPARATPEHIRLIRHAIFFYDLPSVVVPSVAGDLHDASSPDVVVAREA